MVWWQDLLWGFWNGLTAWIVLIVHVFGGWKEFPFYNVMRSGNWYDFGFLLGAGSPLFGALGPRPRSFVRPRVKRHPEPVAAADGGGASIPHGQST
jgi:hypothetical protein